MEELRSPGGGERERGQRSEVGRGTKGERRRRHGRKERGESRGRRDGRDIIRKERRVLKPS